MNNKFLQGPVKPDWNPFHAKNGFFSHSPQKYTKIKIADTATPSEHLIIFTSERRGGGGGGGGGGGLGGRGGAAKIWPRPVQLPVLLTSAGAKMQLSPRSRATLSPSLDGRSAKTTL